MILMLYNLVSPTYFNSGRRTSPEAKVLIIRWQGCSWVASPALSLSQAMQPP